MPKRSFYLDFGNRHYSQTCVSDNAPNNHFRHFFHWPQVSSHLLANESTAKYVMWPSANLWSPVCSFLLSVLSTLTNYLHFSHFSVFSPQELCQPLPAFPFPASELGSSPEAWPGQSQSSSCLFPVSQGSLSFLTSNSLSWKSLFHMFCVVFGCLRHEANPVSFPLHWAEMKISKIYFNI